ncbi:hypothetical protein NYO67_6325 [Aspergillus flavus]|nr:hypothetical protein NYO67_6325 [Aspergillus flavus]
MAERIYHQHTSLLSIIEATGVDNHQLLNTCLTVQPAMMAMTRNQKNVVAIVVLSPSDHELRVRYWDDFFPEREALDLLEQFCDSASKLATAVGSTELGVREKLLA